MLILSCIPYTPFIQAQELNSIADSCAKAFGSLNPFHNDKAKKAETQRALLRDPTLSFGDNFREGDFSDGKAYFVVKQMSFNPRIPLGRIIEKTGPDSAIAEIIDPADGQIQRIPVRLDQQRNGTFYLSSPRNSLFTGIVLQGRPDIAFVFSALKSERERLSYADLNIPKTAKEKPLQTKGLSSAYTRHLDELSKWNSLRKQFQTAQVNPYKTHIDYLEKYIAPYMAYMKEGIAFLPSAELKTRATNKLDKLEKQANKAIQNQTVTYQWWLRFNWDLSDSIQYEHTEPHRVHTNKRGEDRAAFMEYFPLIIVVPAQGEAGIIALNESGPVGVHPIGLTYKMKTVDGIPHYPPFEFTMHDALHGFLSMKLRVTTFHTAHEQFHNRLMELKADLPAEKRKHVELAYFMLTHENDAGKAFVQESPQSMQDKLEKTLNIKTQYNRLNFNGLKSFSHNKEERAQQISQVVKDWTQIFSRIQEELLFAGS